MHKIKTSEIIGPSLDWAVAKCVAQTNNKSYVNTPSGKMFIGSFMRLPHYSPSTNWNQGGLIIENSKITIEFISTIGWRAALDFLDEPQSESIGCDTALIAAMRCYVASKLGDEVEVPHELLTISK